MKRPAPWLTFAAVLALMGGGGGSFLRGAAAEAFGQTVTLPPFIVEQSINESWSIIEAPGFELLSQVPVEQSKQFLQDYSRFYKLLALVCPDYLRPKLDVPERILLYSDTTKLWTVQQLVAELEKVGAPASAAWKNYSYTAKRFAGGLMLRDGETSGLFVMLPEKTTEAYRPGNPPGPEQRLSLSLSQVRLMLEAKVPRPPAWFIDGFTTLYQNMGFTTRSVVLTPLVWISPEETKKIKKYPNRPPPLLPLAEIFRGEQAGDGAEKIALRRAETALFIRWCLEKPKSGDQGLATDDTRPSSNARKAAFWKFVAESSLRAPDEAMFRALFRLSFTEALESMGDFLPTAIGKQQTFEFDTILRPLVLQQRRATRAEMARLKGDWQRLEIDFVRAHFPELVPKYAEQAQRTLLGAYEDGERDPALLAVIGLYYCDLRDYAAARKFLEPAAAAGVVRPRVYFELARLHLTQARAAAQWSGQLHDSESGTIIDLLHRARAQSPPQLPTYLILCDVLASRASAPTPDEVKFLAEGLQLFPHEASLRQAIAQLKSPTLVPSNPR